MVLVQKWSFFKLFFFRQYRQRKCVLWYSRTKKTPFEAKKTRSSKSRKIDISTKGLTHGFGPKMAVFPTFFITQYRLGKCLLWYSRTKKPPFEAKKTRNSKSPKIDIFPNELTHGNGPKMAIFSPFFLRNIGQENVFYDILKRKNASLGYKNKKFKKSKKSHVSKGVNPWFWSKNGHFCNCFF